MSHGDPHNAPFVYGILAIAGGVARYLNIYLRGGKFHIAKFLASGFVAGFSGYMFALFGESTGMDGTVLYVMAGLGGFFGEQTLKLILERFE